MATDIQVTIDSAEPHAQADWWAEALGWRVEPQDEAFIRRMVEAGQADEADTTTHRGALVWGGGGGGASPRPGRPRAAAAPGAPGRRGRPHDAPGRAGVGRRCGDHLTRPRPPAGAVPAGARGQDRQEPRAPRGARGGRGGG